MCELCDEGTPIKLAIIHPACDAMGGKKKKKFRRRDVQT